jgi:histidine triad (HIT) family protein
MTEARSTAAPSSAPSTAEVLDRLFETIQSRRGADPASSYTAKLFHRGTAKIAQKVGEEAVEAVIEAMRRDPAKLAEESALSSVGAMGRCRSGTRAGLRHPGRPRGHQRHRREEGSQTERRGQVMAYDPNNIFARILRGEIPCKKVYEDDHTLAFHDINPQAPVHVLVIPKGAYVSMDDFSANASDAEIAALTRTVGKVARDLGVAEGGYRILSNHGEDAHQEVPHLHIHIFGGRPLGRMLAKGDRAAG